MYVMYMISTSYQCMVCEEVIAVLHDSIIAARSSFKYKKIWIQELIVYYFMLWCLILL